jgi:hypothetical protein
MRMGRKLWRMPELVVLVRGKPEEAVLGGCKLWPHTGPVHGYEGCYQTPGSSGLCIYYCDEPVVS